MTYELVDRCIILLSLFRKKIRCKVGPAFQHAVGRWSLAVKKGGIAGTSRAVILPLARSGIAPFKIMQQGSCTNQRMIADDCWKTGDSDDIWDIYSNLYLTKCIQMWRIRVLKSGTLDALSESFAAAFGASNLGVFCWGKFGWQKTSGGSQTTKGQRDPIHPTQRWPQIPVWGAIVAIANSLSEKKRLISSSMTFGGLDRSRWKSLQTTGPMREAG